MTFVRPETRLPADDVGRRGWCGEQHKPLRGAGVEVLVAARDIRVRRALSALLELVDRRTVAVTHTADLVPALDAAVTPELVVLEMDRTHEAQDLRVIERVALHGVPVIAVCSGTARRAAVLAAGAQACLDKDDPGFADRLADAVRRRA